MIVGDIWKVLLILIILAILGINIFFYIYRGAKIISKDIESGIIQTASNIGQTSTSIMKKTADTSESILKELENDLIPKIEYKNPRFDSNDSQSIISNNKPVTGTSGYCYVGLDKNIRSCVQMYPSDVCMSGNVFPSMDICINPSLRV